MNNSTHRTAAIQTPIPRPFSLSNSNGKEKDYESGFHYYGARYYWSEVLTGWSSVDPMADKYPNVSPYNYCIWNPTRLVDPDGRDTVKIYLDKGRFSYREAEGDHCIEFYRAGAILKEETMTIPREKCETIKELKPAIGTYSENEEIYPYVTLYLEFSSSLWGKSVFEKIARLGATRNQESKEWDYYVLGNSGELSSSGIKNKMIHSPKHYINFSEWHHFHPFNEDESYYPSPTDQDKARANPVSTCTIYSQGRHLEFGGMVPRKGYIDLKKFGNTWRTFAK